MLSKIVEDICVTNDNIFKRSFSFVPWSSFWHQLAIAYNKLYFEQAVLHESSLLKENLTALKEEAEVDFFFLWRVTSSSHLWRWKIFFVKVKDDQIEELTREIQMYYGIKRHIEELTKENQAML